MSAVAFQDDVESFELKQKRNQRKPIYIGVFAVAAVVIIAGIVMMAAGFGQSELEITHDETTMTASEATQEISQPQTIFVHVGGSVANPGVYEVPVGARVGDAVSAAGGMTESAARDALNLARELTDGEQIIVPVFEEQVQTPTAPTTAPTTTAPQISEPATTTTPSTSSTAGGLININQATSSQLEELPGIGEATAAKIIADREANGPFKTIEDLKRVSGIGDKKFEQLQSMICVG